VIVIAEPKLFTAFRAENQPLASGTSQENQAEFTDLYLIPRRKYFRVARLTVDISSVQRTNINYHVLAVVKAEFGMAPRHSHII